MIYREFVYHNIKNLGFDESNVHVHVSNGGHSDIVAIEWEIELVYKYQAEDTAGYFSGLFQRELAQPREAMDVFPKAKQRASKRGTVEELG